MCGGKWLQGRQEPHLAELGTPDSLGFVQRPQGSLGCFHAGMDRNISAEEGYDYILIRNPFQQHCPGCSESSVQKRRAGARPGLQEP